MTKKNDASVTRVVDAPRAIVWRAWTGHLPEWFTPAPWRLAEHELDLAPGGVFRNVMAGRTASGST